MKVSFNQKRISIIISSIILSISALSLISILFFANRTQGKVAEQQLQMYLDKIRLKTEMEDNNILLTLNIAKSWVNNGLLKNKDFDNLNGKFSSLISTTPQVSAISFIKSTGESYSMRYDSLNYESYMAKNDSINKNLLLVTGLEGVIRAKDTVIRNSISSLPNYIRHRDVPIDSIVRYPVQSMPGMKKMAGVGFSINTRDTINNELYTLTAYTSIKRIYNFISSIKLTNDSEVHLFTADGNFFDYRKLNENKIYSASGIEGFMVSWEDIKGTAFYNALKKWETEGQTDSLRFVKTSFGREDYWTAFKPNRDAANGIWTGLLMPETDFSVIIKGRFGFVLIVSLILLVVSVVFIVFAIRYLKGNNFMELLSADELESLINAGENDSVEFKSTIRMNLHANKPGKEIELAWLKSVVAFCNTDGGRILIGVKDDGTVCGLDADRFPNEDKTLLHVQNLIKQHVGLEFAKYIHYSLREVGGNKIVVVRCQALSRPVFLKFNDKEQFFVRSGPASIELPVSKALEYINSRNKD